MTFADLRPSERLSGLALAALTGATLLLRPAGWLLPAVVFPGLFAGILLLVRNSPGTLAGGLRDFSPAAVVLAVFLLLQPLLTAANPARWDTVLAGVDARWFGSLAAAWHGAFGRPSAFTDLVYLGYASFYFLPLAVAVLARTRLGPDRFEAVVFTLLLGFYLSFLGYFLWPAEGPRVPPALEATQLGGGAVSRAVRAFLHGAETTTLDAFPSGHTALSVVSAALASRPFPKLAPLLWIWALGIIFATVYIRAHYLVDLAAGLLLAGSTLALAPLLQRTLKHGKRAPE
jgi:membrane-associated phospholipid phosphatase